MFLTGWAVGLFLLLLMASPAMGQSAGSVTANSNSCASLGGTLVIASAVDASFPSGNPSDIVYDWIISDGGTTLNVSTGNVSNYTLTPVTFTTAFTVIRKATDPVLGLPPVFTTPVTVNINPLINITSGTPKTCTNLTSFPVTYSFAGIPSIPDEYSIQWSPAAALAGFVNVPASSLNPGGGSFNVSLPTTPTAGNFVGTITLKVTSTGCVTSGPSSVDVYTPPTLTINDPAAVCAPTTIDITNNFIRSGANTYSYFTDAAATTTVTTPAAVTTSGTYYIRGTSTAATGSCLSTVDPVHVTVTPVPSISITNPAVACAPATVDLTAAAITTGSTAGLIFSYWTDAAATISYSTPATATPGTYYIKGTTSLASGNCVAVQQPVTVTITPVPTISITNPSVICAPLTIDITNAAITTGSTAGLSFSYWSDAAATIPYSTPGTAVNGTYYIKGTTSVATGSCVATQQPVTVSITPVPTINITAPAAVCAPATVDISNAAITAGSTAGLTLSYWSDAAATIPYGTPSIATAGTYYIRGTTSLATGNCVATQKPVTVVVTPTPSINITNPAAVCAPSTVNLTAAAITTGSTAGLIYSYWTDAAATIPYNTPTVANSGTYYIKGVSSVATGSCVATQKPVTVLVNAAPAVPVVSGPASFCAGASVTLNATAANSYAWTTGATGSSITVNSAGSYGVTITDLNGCSASSSLKIVSVNALPATPVITGTAAFCTGLSTTLSTSGGGTYLWSTGATSSSIVVNNSGNYDVTITDNNGCASTSAIKTVIENPLPATPIITGNTSFCSGGSTTLSSTPSNTYLWSNGAVGSSLNLNTGGTYTVKVTDGNGCSATSAPTIVTVNPLPLITITDPVGICAPGTVDITSPTVTAGSTSGLNYSYWGNAANTVGVNTPSALAIPGTYYILGVSPLTGCSNSKPVQVTIYSQPVLRTTNPAAVCEPATIDLTAASITSGSTTGLVYSYWSNAATTTAVANATAISTSGTYYIRGINATGCAVSLPVTITVNKLPNGTLQDPPANFICEGTARLLTTVSNASRFQWYKDLVIISNAVASTYSATTSGNYTVQFISPEGCVKDAGKTVRFDLVTKATLQFSVSNNCEGLVTTFTNNSQFASSGGMVWAWNFGDGSSSSAFSASRQFAAAGSYQVTLTVDNTSCPNLNDQLTKNIVIETPVSGIRYADVLAGAGKSFTLIARGFGTRYDWVPAVGLSNATVASPSGVLQKDTSYIVRISSAAGCITSDTVRVKIVNQGEIFVPQGFTPNGDGQNDRLYPDLVVVQKLHYFRVFNRWGNMVFQTTDATPQSGWDGKINGVLQPTGTFVWTAEAEDVFGNILKRSGTVILIR